MGPEINYWNMIGDLIKVSTFPASTRNRSRYNFYGFLIKNQKYAMPSKNIQDVRSVYHSLLVFALSWLRYNAPTLVRVRAGFNIYSEIIEYF